MVRVINSSGCTLGCHKVQKTNSEHFLQHMLHAVNPGNMHDHG